MSCLFVGFDSFCLFSFLRKFLDLLTEAKNITVALAIKKSDFRNCLFSIEKRMQLKGLNFKIFHLAFFLQRPAATRLGFVQFLFKYWEQRIEEVFSH